MTNTTHETRPSVSPKLILSIGVVLSLAILALVHWTYFYTPFSETFPSFWSDYLPYFIILIPALGAAIAGTLVVKQFEKDEPPYRVWLMFAIGWWFWAAGEVSGLIYGAVYYSDYASYPDFALTDVFWLVGYFFLGLSLYFQLQLVYVQKGKGARLFLGIIAAALVAAVGLTNLAQRYGLGEGMSWFNVFISVLYPVLDLVEGATAIWLSFIFGRGQWVRPWWGVISFALADAIDSFYWAGGYGLIPVSVQTIMDYTSLAVYPASYLIVFLALLSNYFILRYGENSGLLKSSRPLS